MKLFSLSKWVQNGTFRRVLQPSRALNSFKVAPQMPTPDPAPFLVLLSARACIREQRVSQSRKGSKDKGRPGERIAKQRNKIILLTSQFASNITSATTTNTFQECRKREDEEQREKAATRCTGTGEIIWPSGLAHCVNQSEVESFLP